MPDVVARSVTGHYNITQESARRSWPLTPARPRKGDPINIFDRGTGMVLGKPSRFVEGFPSSVLGGMQVVEEEPEDPA